MAVSRGYQFFNVAGVIYFTLHKHQMWPRVVTDDPHTMKSKVVVVCHGDCTPEDDARQVYMPGTRVCPLLTYGHSSLKTTERHPTLQSTLSRYQNSRAWRCRDVSGSVARGTCDLNRAASRRFLMVLVDTAGAICTRISSLNNLRAATGTRTKRRS